MGAVLLSYYTSLVFNWLFRHGFFIYILQQSINGCLVHAHSL